MSEKITDIPFLRTTPVCITASGNILASGTIRLKLLMPLLQAIELFPFRYIVTEHHIAQLWEFFKF